jgi:hypothetical protein
MFMTTDSSNAPFLDLPNNQQPKQHTRPFYGSTPVPHPTNETAKCVDHAKCMRVVFGKK